MAGRGKLCVIVLAAVLVSKAPEARSDDAAGNPPPDAFAAALAEMGLQESDLARQAKRHWNRYPHPATVPHTLPFFEDLHASPLDTYEFTRTLGNAVRELLGPQLLREDPKALHKLAVLLATERRIGGFRAYGANLDPRPTSEEPLLHALLALFERTGRPSERMAAFGNPAGEHDVDPVAEIRSLLAAVPAALRLPLARLVLGLIDARTWIDRGLRKVPQDLRDAVFDAVPELAQGTSGGQAYFPAIDDVAPLVDEHSLWYGCLKGIQAVSDARREIAAVLVPEAGWPDFEMRLGSPWGALVFQHGRSGKPLPEDLLLLVRWGGSESIGRLGATGRRRPLSVALLLESEGPVGCGLGSELADCPNASLASGILGCGIVYASGSSANLYRTDAWGMGAGLFGLGALVDEGGNDEYRMRSVGMGAAFFGAGLLLDAAGNDHYVLGRGDGQGFGGPGGIGVLADRSGDDDYFSEPDAGAAGRADYHSDYKVAVSFAQGVGVGRRGDGTDGHAWAGGLGALIDVAGNDRYRAGNFSLGAGYWLGTGLLWDGAGNDDYHSVFYSQGSGAHFAVGALIDEQGDDVHLLEENAGLGFGWDVVTGFLIDRGNGNDRYEARSDSTGTAMLRSEGFFLDEGGDDTYVVAAKSKALGDVDDRPRYSTQRSTSTFWYHLTQVGLFLDCGGDDTYQRREADGTLIADEDAGNDRSWHRREKKPGARTAPNVSIGKDVQQGRIGFLDPWPRRRAPPTP